MRIALLAAAAALLTPGAASAQQREFAFEEIVTDLAYGYCPLFLANQFSLNAPELAERGFGKTIEKKATARGEIELVSLKRADGEIAFGGAAGRNCTVVIMGEKRSTALAKLREAMSWTGLDFKPAPPSAAAPPGVTIESFKAAVEDQFLYVQLIQGGGPTPVVMAQLYALEK